MKSFLKILLSLVLIFFVAILIIFFESMRENKNFVTEEYTIRTEKINNNTNFLFISDFHETIYGDENKDLYNVIDSLNYDYILNGGDNIIDSKKNPDKTQTTYTKELIDKYQQIFAYGNHEYRLKKSKLEKNKEEHAILVENIKEKGSTLLINDYIELDNNIRVYGIYLRESAYGFYHDDNINLKDFFDDLDKSYYNILLMHSPVYFQDAANYGFDLVLSGHFHGGFIRIFGRSLIGPGFELFPKYGSGFHKLNDSYLIASRGLGGHTIKIRINNKPELSYIKLVKESK